MDQEFRLVGDRAGNGAGSRTAGIPDARDWDRPSLCAGWRIRDVAAHVALAPTPPSLVSGLLIEGARAAAGSQTQPRRRGPARDRPPRRRLVTELREHAGSRRPAVTGYRNTLFDVLVHAQDVALPLGLDHPMPVEAARAGAQRVWTRAGRFGPGAGSGTFRLVATDIDWRPETAPSCRVRSPHCFSCSPAARPVSTRISGAGADRLRQPVGA
jgi:uncharacterized protein (TIGR03083 family)